MIKNINKTFNIMINKVNKNIKKNNKILLLFIYLILFIVLFIYIYNIFINLPLDKIKNLETSVTYGPNMYSNKKVIIANFKIDNYQINQKIKNEIINLHELIGYTNSYSDIIKNKIIFDYDDEISSIKAVTIAYYKVFGTYKNLDKKIENLKKEYQYNKLGPSTKSIIDEAIKNNIPYIRMNDNSLIQLGWCKNQKRIEASTTSNTSAIGEAIAKNKELTKKMLTSIGIPVPYGYLIEEGKNAEDDLLKYYNILGPPVVIKPYDGNHGNGVTTNINNIDELKKAYKIANKISEYVLIEKYIIGNDYRILIINNKFVAAAKRNPALVVGDGYSTIYQLIIKTNNDPRRGDEHTSELTKIIYDDAVSSYISEQGYTKSSIPEKNKIVYLRKNANLSTGGTAEDVTDIIHPTIINYAIDASIQIDIDICGVDIICKDISKPLEVQGGAFIEINSGPGLRMHIFPSIGKSRNVCEPIIKGLFPSNNGRVPIVSITGTNGKTTTVNILAYIAKLVYNNVGKTTTNGVYINNDIIEFGDCSGPKSAQKILMNPNVDICIFESARGGLLKGLAYDYSDIGVITNIGKGDHIGNNYESSNIDELIQIKNTVIKNISKNGYAILNANDSHIYKIIPHVSCKNIIYFSINPNNNIINNGIKNGERVVYYDGSNIIYLFKNKKEVFYIQNILILKDNIVHFQIENIMVVIASAIALNIDINIIKKGLSTFENNIKTNPGRFNILNYNNSTLILDYAHNLDSIIYISKYFENKSANKKIVMFGAAGDREDNVIKKMTEYLYNTFDVIILFVTEETKRGRSEKELINLMKSNIGNDKKIEILLNENEAIDKSLSYANQYSKDIILLLIDNVKDSIEYIMDKIKK